MARCTAIKAKGGRCKNLAATGSDYCPAHDPARADARKRSASKGGRSKGGGAELKELKREVRAVIGGVLNGRVDKGSGSVALQGFNVLIRATEQERKLLETQELVERVEALEQLSSDVPNRRGGAVS
jgi:hypothetical protein